MNGDEYLGIVHQLLRAKRDARYEAQKNLLERLYRNLGDWFRHSNRNFDMDWWMGCWNYDMEGAQLPAPPSRMYADGPPRINYNDYTMQNEPMMAPRGVPRQYMTAAEISREYPSVTQAAAQRSRARVRSVSPDEYAAMSRRERMEYEGTMMNRHIVEEVAAVPYATWQTIPPPPSSAQAEAERIVNELHNAIAEQTAPATVDSRHLRIRLPRDTEE